MKPSGIGRLGPGVYVTSSKEAARCVAESGRFGTEGIVLTLEVDLGTMRNMYDQDTADGTDSWRQGRYDSAYAKHPPWLGCNDGLREYVIPDARRVKLVNVD